MSTKGRKRVTRTDVCEALALINLDEMSHQIADGSALCAEVARFTRELENCTEKIEDFLREQRRRGILPFPDLD